MTALDDLVPDPPRPGPPATAGDGVRLATWDLGGAGPPVLLVHATGFHAWTWLPVAEALRATHRVWALDLRGHGTSDPGPGRSYLDWNGFALDVLAAVDALGLAGAGGAGHSLGGAALLMAERLRPGTFSALHCYEPIVLPAPVSRNQNALADGARRRRNRFPSAAAAVANFKGKPPMAHLAPGVVEAYVAHAFADEPDGGVALRLPGPEEATVYEGALDTGLYAGLGDVGLPVTVAGGDLGPPDGPGSLVDDLAARLPAGRAEHFSTLGHFGPMEDPPAVAASITATVAPPH